MTIRIRPQGVCSREMELKVEDGVIRRLEGIHCGFKSTSCPDQLAQGLKNYVRDAGN